MLRRVARSHANDFRLLVNHPTARVFKKLCHATSGAVASFSSVSPARIAVTGLQPSSARYRCGSFIF
jgi:hypothetical protein